MGRVPAAASALSGLLFVALLGLLHVLEPAFDPRWRFVSEYALGRYGWLMSIAFVALAVSLAAGALAVRRDVHDWIGYLGLFGLAPAASRARLPGARFGTGCSPRMP
jgi:hypothetical protein